MSQQYKMYRVLPIIMAALCLASCGNRSQNVAAVVNGHEIRRGTIDKAIEMQLYEHIRAIYDLRNTATEEYVSAMILDMEADKNGLSTDEYIEKYITTHATESYKANFVKEQGYSKGIPVIKEGIYRYEGITTTEGQAELRNRMGSSLKSELIDSLKKVYNVELRLQEPVAPKIDIDDAIKYKRGNAKSRVHVSIITDYDCSICRDMHKVYEHLFEEFGDYAEFVHIDLSGFVTPSARGALAASKQDMFWLAHDTLMNARNNLDSAEVAAVLASIGVDMDQYMLDYADDVATYQLRESEEMVYSKGIVTTPAILINGHPLSNAADERLVRREIKRAIEESKR